MEKELKIINIDGVEGIGKTTQINMLTRYFLDLGVDCLSLNLEDTIVSGAECIENTKEFLKTTPNGVVICDGSIARAMAIDLVNGTPTLSINKKYKDIIYEYECLNHQFGVANILIIMDNIQTCHERILKRGKLLGVAELGIQDFVKERRIVKALRHFDNNLMSKSLNFHVLKTEEMDSILVVQKKILDYLEENFKIKKPSK